MRSVDIDNRKHQLIDHQAFQMFKRIRPLAHARRFPLDPEKDE